MSGESQYRIGSYVDWTEKKRVIRAFQGYNNYKDRMVVHSWKMGNLFKFYIKDPELIEITVHSKPVRLRVPLADDDIKSIIDMILPNYSSDICGVSIYKEKSSRKEIVEQLVLEKI